MNQPAASAAHEINALHEEVTRCTAVSQHALHAALVAAWRAGHLLLAEKQRVRRAMGGGAWLLWLQQHFRASRRTACNYMRLAQSVSDVSFLPGLSLRQAYFRLGIATEPKSRAASLRFAPLPAHLRLAARLVRALRSGAVRRLPPEQAANLRQDLHPLYECLRSLFEAKGTKSRASTPEHAL